MEEESRRRYPGRGIMEKVSLRSNHVGGGGIMEPAETQEHRALVVGW